MRRAAVILLALLLSGCTLLRHDAVVRSVFPDEAAFETGIPVKEEWAR